MNQTLIERAKSMRIHTGLSKTIWADAINIATYLINRSPPVPLDYRLPDEVWSDKKVNPSKCLVVLLMFILMMPLEANLI